MLNHILKAVKFVHKSTTDLLGTISQSKPLDFNSVQYLIPYGLPHYTDKDYILICRTGYISIYSPSAKIPACVCYTLTPEHCVEKVPRGDSFAADYSLDPNQRATLADYKSIAEQFDRGHCADSADMRWDANVQRQSFYLSNIVPQNKQFNELTWKYLEEMVRKWAINRKNTLAIYIINIFNENSKTAGNDKVIIPEKMTKIVIDTKTKEFMCFSFNNETLREKDISKFKITLKELEIESSFNFNFENLIESVEIWPI